MAIIVCLDWKGGIYWLYVSILILMGLYGFANLAVSSRMVEFSTSPIGLFLSGKAKKYELAVLLIRHSDEQDAPLGDKYRAIFSFIEKSGARISISAYGFETCQQITDYLKECLSDRCVIMEMTFLEYDENRRSNTYT